MYWVAEHRADGWHLIGKAGEDVGPFATIVVAEEFLDWNAARPQR